MMTRRQLVLTAFALALLGCGNSANDPSFSNNSNQPPATASNFSGRVQNTDFFIGLSADDKRFFAYVCDSIRAQRFEGGLQDTIPGFTVTFSNGQAQGTVLIDNVSRSFTATPSNLPNGLYWANTVINGVPTFGGWILDAGQEKGVVSATLPNLSAPAQQPSSSIIAILIGLRTPVTAPPPFPGAAPVTAIRDGTSNIKDGTSNIQDGTSN
jgi:hypothetical protein